MTTFNKFTDLPGEIRTLIWSYVIREDRPGVHIFSQCDQAQSRCMISLGDVSATFSEPLSSRYFAGANKNVSTYLIDGGLWTACKESREIMESKFRRSEWVKDPSSSSAVSEYEEARVRRTALSKEESLKVSSTGNFWGSPFHQLTTFPHRDLFVLQTDCLDGVEWRGIGMDCGMGDSTLWAHDGLHNIGIEFNSDWWDSEEEDWDWTLLEILDDGAHTAFNSKVRTIWIIDHGLKRKKNAPTIKEMSTEHKYKYLEFYASDRKLVEVDWRNIGHFTNSNPKALDEEGWSLGNSSVEFAERLEEEINVVEDPGFETKSGFGCTISVLGWDDLKS